MKKSKIIFTSIFVVMALLAMLMVSNGWPVFGFIMFVCAFSGAVAYYDILENNSEPVNPNKNRRSRYYDTLTPKVKEKELQLNKK